MYLVCGEALFDFFLESTAEVPGNQLLYRAIAGGSPFNVAVGLARLDVPVGLFAGLSRDHLGRRLHQVLVDEGVGTEQVLEVDAPTTLAMVGVDALGAPQYSFRGEGCADRLLQHLPKLAEQVRGLHLGSYSLVVEPIGTTLLALVERESGRRLISLDPNIRLNVEPDLLRWRARIEAFARHAHLIKVSDEDLALLYPGEDPEHLAQGWLDHRCELVLLTRGRQGASLFSRRHGQRSQPARAVVTRDTVGAGDSFQAAVLAYLHEQGLDNPESLALITPRQLDALLAFAVTAAALTCSRLGPQLPYRHELPL
ncbi:MAG: carbohydrate kinase [Pseudomonas sp.]|uniref:carbohydrate kinase family protein n=1 Tax=Pseudomonas sp. TaxID=306 RepID=UPI003397CD3B